MADDEPKPAITIADEALTELRAQVRSLLGLIDTGRKPPPAILAACDWAESGPPEQARRYPALDEDDRRSGRTFICGRP